MMRCPKCKHKFTDESYIKDHNRTEIKCFYCNYSVKGSSFIVWEDLEEEIKEAS